MSLKAASPAALARADGDATPHGHASFDPSRSLVERLGEALSDAEVGCVQWKGHAKRARWMSGDGDIDLLLDRSSEARFQGVLAALGFHRADPPRGRGVAGLEHYFGLDAAGGRLIHVHAHYRLLVGGYWRTIYHLPIEAPLIAAAVPAAVFPVPAPEFELIAAAVRLVQRHTLLDTLRRRRPPWSETIEEEVAAAHRMTDRTALAHILARHLPCLDLAFIDACVRWRGPGSSRWHRLRLRWDLARRLRAHAHRPPVAVTLSRLLGWTLARLGRRGRGTGGKRLAHGGTVVALVGGDGAGKSTCVAALRDWLGGEFALLTAHLGRPPRSLATLAVGAVLRAARGLGVARATDDERTRGAGYLAALRDVCTARDRYRLYVQARRFALAGGVALCERYPIPENWKLSGPRLDAFRASLARTWLGRRLVASEAWYYRQMPPPDLLIVLRVEPEIAVQRKTTEPADYVRTRNQYVWDTDWRSSGAHVIDAGRPLPDVLADLKGILWQEL